MKHREKHHASSSKDQALRWTMRAVGFILIGVSLFFLSRDITQATTTIWFFTVSAGIGTLTLISSWLPGPQKPHLEGQPVFHQPDPRRR